MQCGSWRRDIQQIAIASAYSGAGSDGDQREQGQREISRDVFLRGFGAPRELRAAETTPPRR